MLMLRLRNIGIRAGIILAMGGITTPTRTRGCMEARFTASVLDSPNIYELRREEISLTSISHFMFSLIYD